MMAGVWSLWAGTAAEELVGEAGAAVMTTMLTTVEACPAEFEVMEVKVCVENPLGMVVIVAVQVLALILQPKRQVCLPSRVDVDENGTAAEDMALEDGMAEASCMTLPSSVEKKYTPAQQSPSAFSGSPLQHQ
jgi:hypothetical protein